MSTLDVNETKVPQNKEFVLKSNFGVMLLLDDACRFSPECIDFGVLDTLTAQARC